MKYVPRRFFLLAAFLACGLPVWVAFAQSGPTTGGGSGGEKPAERITDFGPFVIEPPPEWVAETPTSPMRKAQYRIPAAGDDRTKDAEHVVFFFGAGQGGGLEDNLKRWKGQFKKAEGTSEEEFAKTTKKEIDGIPVTILEVRGDYTGAAMGGQPASIKADQLMLAAVVETRDGAYFLKTIGPRATMEPWKAAWYKMVEGLKAKKK